MSWVADTVRPYVGNRVLEINAGVGIIALNLMPRAVYWATDSNPLFLDDLRKLSRTRPYLQVAHTDVAKPLSFPAGQTFDTVVGLHIIERAKDDVAALQNIREVLEEHGRAIILVPQGPKLYGSMDRALGYYRRYTKEQLIAVGQLAGFRVREVLDFNRMGRLLWWLNSCVLRRTAFGLWPSKMLDLLIPLFRYLDPYLPLPALSLITILEKVSDDDGTGT
jgi:SAM-dependent methyltransferase